MEIFLNVLLFFLALFIICPIFNILFLYVATKYNFFPSYLKLFRFNDGDDWYSSKDTINKESIIYPPYSLSVAIITIVVMLYCLIIKPLAKMIVYPFKKCGNFVANGSIFKTIEKNMFKNELKEKVDCH